MIPDIPMKLTPTQGKTDIDHWLAAVPIDAEPRFQEYQDHDA